MSQIVSNKYSSKIKIELELGHVCVEHYNIKVTMKESIIALSVSNASSAKS